MSNGYPALLNLTGKHCLVIGGGSVATRKVSDLLEAGAQVTVVSPYVEDSLQALADKGCIEIHPAAYASDMIGHFRPLLVFAATSSPAVNQQIIEDAGLLNILANRTDDGEKGTFTNMATIRQDRITIGIATGGAAPTLALHLKDRIAPLVGMEYAILARWMAEMRPRVLEHIPAEESRAAFWRSVVTSSILDSLRGGNEDQARTTLDRLWAEHAT